jgi:hypothetical protein
VGSQFQPQASGFKHTQVETPKGHGTPLGHPVTRLFGLAPISFFSFYDDPANHTASEFGMNNEF